jgi:hypothetical protein
MAAAASAGLLSVLALLSACGGGASVSPGEERCRNLCIASLSCPSAGGAQAGDCYTMCDDLEGLNQLNDCYDEVDDYYRCIERVGICADIDAECPEQQDVYSDCLSEQCSTDPDRDICL